MNKLKVVVCGGRDFNDWDLLVESLDRLLPSVANIEIVSGGARGADKLGEKYAKASGLELKIFNADWETFGMSAGVIRNSKMADYADMCICFWDGESKGTRNMIESAIKNNLRVEVIDY